jgi:pyridoxal biosynthesis lyase PdxS
MALERVPADIRKHGGIARMSDPAVRSRSRSLFSCEIF